MSSRSNWSARSNGSHRSGRARHPRGPGGACGTRAPVVPRQPFRALRPGRPWGTRFSWLALNLIKQIIIRYVSTFYIKLHCAANFDHTNDTFIPSKLFRMKISYCSSSIYLLPSVVSEMLTYQINDVFNVIIHYLFSYKHY